METRTGATPRPADSGSAGPSEDARPRSQDARPRSQDARAQPQGARAQGLGTIVIDDFRRGGLAPVIRRDLALLYEFYVDEERRERLGRMNQVVRWLYLTWWLIEELIRRLPPARRALLLASFVTAILGEARFRFGEWDLSFSLAPLAFGLVLVVLMLELKDRLLAHDELSIGRQVQMALLPKSEPVVPGWSIWIYTRPANHVGGDLVDFLPLAAGAAGVALGDVAGKGLGAALLMAKLQATLRAIAPDGPNLGEVGARLNRILCRDGLPNRFATLVYLEIDPASPAVRLLNAGHLPAVVLRTDAIERVPAPAPPLGIAPDVAFAEQSVTLAAGDTLIVHSDGLSEARSAQGEFFGEKVLDSLWPTLRGGAPSDVGRRLLDAVASFAGEETLDDDLSLVVVQRSGQAGAGS